MPDRPTVALALPDRRIEPGGGVTGELWLRGGAEPLVIDRLRARLWVRVHADFDDDDGAAHVRLYDGTIGEDVHFGAHQTTRTEVRLAVPWGAPVTRSNGDRLEGLSVMVMIWGDGAVPVDSGIHQIEVDPLPWQQSLLTACERSGLRWETNLAYPGSQQITSFPLAGRRWPEVALSWRVQRRRVTVDLFGYRRQPYRLRLTHAEAMRVDWADQLSGWLAMPTPTD